MQGPPPRKPDRLAIRPVGGVRHARKWAPARIGRSAPLPRSAATSSPHAHATSQKHSQDAIRRVRFCDVDTSFTYIPIERLRASPILGRFVDFFPCLGRLLECGPRQRRAATSAAFSVGLPERRPEKAPAAPVPTAARARVWRTCASRGSGSCSPCRPWQHCLRP